MSQLVMHLKPLFLSEEEAMALLNLCLTSNTETDAAKDRAMLKLTELVRRYIAVEAECAETKAAAEKSPQATRSAGIPEAGDPTYSSGATSVPNAGPLPCDNSPGLKPSASFSRLKFSASPKTAGTFPV